MEWTSKLFVDSIFQVRHVILLLCQFINKMSTTRLPVYYPSQEEKDNPKLYAENVRRLMAREVYIGIIYNIHIRVHFHFIICNNYYDYVGCAG